MSMEMVLGLISRHPSDVPAVWRLFLIECGSPILSLPVLWFPGVTSISDQISTLDHQICHPLSFSLQPPSLQLPLPTCLLLQSPINSFPKQIT
jgi:hypothetical protein